MSEVAYNRITGRIISAAIEGRREKKERENREKYVGGRL